MDIRRLRYFVAVAEEGHFTRAAERLGIRQPPLSAQIRELEKELGAPLFHRGTRGVTVTDAGKVLLKEARDILDRVDQAKRMVKHHVRGETGSMIVGFAAATYLVALVPGIIRTYLEQYPQVTVRVQQSNTFELVDALREGRVDAAFIRPPIHDQTEVRLEPIIDEEMIVVLPRGHRLEAAEAVTLASLSEETFTVPPRSISPGYYDSMISTFNRAGLCPRIGQESATLAAIPSMVAAGFGISVVPRSLNQLNIDHVVYRPIAGGVLHAPIALACRRRNCPPTTRHLMDVARNCVRNARPAAG
jgi:DNA-binding transcriptional LysR family regulator